MDIVKIKKKTDFNSYELTVTIEPLGKWLAITGFIILILYSYKSEICGIF